MELPKSFKLQLFCRMLSKESNRLAYTKFQKHIPVLPQGRSRCSSQYLNNQPLCDCSQ